MRTGPTCAAAIVAGGFAFGVFCLSAASAADPQPAPAPAPRRAPLPDDRLGVRTAPLLLLSRPDVREDLGLIDSQVEKAEAAIASLYVRAAGLKGKTGVQAVAMRKEIDEAQRVWFETHLRPEQLNRLVQIDLQWEGPSALISRPVVSDTIGLSPEQRTRLKQAVAARDAARAARGPAIAAATAEQTLARQALSLLTTPQRDRWSGMLGKPFAPRIASKNETPTTR